MQYLGSKGKIKNQIARIINSEIYGWQVKHSKTNRRNNQQMCGGGV